MGGCTQQEKQRDDLFKEAWSVQWHRPSFQAISYENWDIGIIHQRKSLLFDFVFHSTHLESTFDYTLLHLAYICIIVTITII